MGDVLAAQDEVVRIEEAAQIGVGEDARRRRIAGALELRQLDRCERVDRRDLVDDEDGPAGARDAHELGDEQLGPARVVQRAQRPGEIERERVEWQVLAVRHDDLDVRRGIRACSLGELLVDLDRDDLAHARGKRERERARAGADVEHPLVAREGEEVPSARRARPRLPPPGRPALGIALAHESITTRRARKGDELMPQASS